MEPDISIIVPVYNVELFLDQGISSLLAQTHSNIEIILIDDGSTDESSLICDSWARKDSRIQVIHQNNQGVSVARNVGIEKSIGKYIMFFDPDDWLNNDCCDIIFDSIENKNVDIVLFQNCDEYEGKTIEYPKGNAEFDNMKKLQLSILKQTRLDFCCPIEVPWGRIIRKEFLVKYNLRFQPGIKVSQDGLFNLNLFEHLDNVYCIDYIGYHYRQNTGSINCKFNPNMPNIIKDFIVEADKFIHKYHNNDVDYKKALGIRCIKMIGLLERTFFFHKESKLTYKQICKGYLSYINDEIISRYINICNFNECDNWRMKMRFFLLKRGNLAIYIYSFLALLNQKIRILVNHQFKAMT